jgi:hypothetical protein
MPPHELRPKLSIERTLWNKIEIQRAVPNTTVNLTR